MIPLFDEYSFKLFFDEYFKTIYSFTLNYVLDGDVARDITQESFIKIYKRRKNFEIKEKALAYLYTTAKNLCLDYIKHQKIKEKNFSAITDDTLQDNLLNELMYNETLQILQQAIDSLPQQMKKVIMLGMNEKSNIEIAEEMNISINSVKTLKRIAYKKLRLTFSLTQSILLLLRFELNISTENTLKR